MTGAGDFLEETHSLVLVEHSRMNGVGVTERHTARPLSADCYTHFVETMMDGAFRLTSTLTYKKCVAITNSGF